jgi:hypothetical protein
MGYRADIAVHIGPWVLLPPNAIDVPLASEKKSSVISPPSITGPRNNKPEPKGCSPGYRPVPDGNVAVGAVEINRHIVRVIIVSD